MPPKIFKEEVKNVLSGLINGSVSRSEASDWAWKLVVADVDTEDEKTWDALDSLSGADEPTTDRDYLYGQSDFERWLKDLLE